MILILNFWIKEKKIKDSDHILYLIDKNETKRRIDNWIFSLTSALIISPVDRWLTYFNR